jgi:hypothetical protein
MEHEVMPENSGVIPNFLVSIVGFVVVLGMFWLFNCGYISRVVGSSIGFTHAFMSLAQHFSNDQVNSKVIALSTLANQLFNNDVIHIGKSMVAFLCSLKDVTGHILCHAKQLPLIVFVAPCLWLSTLIVLVTKGPSEISKLVFHSKEVKLKRSVSWSIEKFIQKKDLQDV